MLLPPPFSFTHPPSPYPPPLPLPLPPPSFLHRHSSLLVFRSARIGSGGPWPLHAVANRIGSDCFAGKKVDHDLLQGDPRHAERKKKKRRGRISSPSLPPPPSSSISISSTFFLSFGRERVYPVCIYVASKREQNVGQ